ncbi:hypothetical protein ACLOJK_028260, partial [Asimina triloba]
RRIGPPAGYVARTGGGALQVLAGKRSRRVIVDDEAGEASSMRVAGRSICLGRANVVGLMDGLDWCRRQLAGGDDGCKKLQKNGRRNELGTKMLVVVSVMINGGRLGLPDGVLPVDGSDGEKAFVIFSVVGGIAGVVDGSGLPEGGGLGGDDILGGSDPPIGPHRGGDRRQPWMPPSMVMVEHHIGAPLVHCVLYTRDRVVALGNLDLRIKYPVVNPKTLRRITS